MSGNAFLLPIEAGHVALFQRAIDANASECAVAPPGTPVPGLTFVQVADHFDPHFARRPTHGDPCFGSGASASGAPANSDEALGLFHTDQLFTYHRHPHIGKTLSVERVAPNRWTRQGRRGGQLEFIERMTDFSDAAGNPVITAAWRDVHTERKHSEVSNEQASEPEIAETLADTTRTTLAEDITRTQLVMYAGVSGDFHPLHHDEPYVPHLRYPAVFVPSMLTWPWRVAR